MRIESNISAVIGRVKRLKDRDIPTALRATMRPERWRELAEREARIALRANAQPGQMDFIEGFMDTLLVDVFGGTGFFFRMHTPFTAAQTLEDYRSAREAVSPGDLGLSLFQKDVTAFEQLMAEWVATEKDKDKRDAGKTDEEIGNWLAYVLLTPDGGRLLVKNSDKKENIGRPVRDVFLPYIVDFLQRKAAVARLDAATVDTWLKAVLAAWRRMVSDLFPEMFHRELMTARSELSLA